MQQTLSKVIMTRLILIFNVRKVVATISNDAQGKISKLKDFFSLHFHVTDSICKISILVFSWPIGSAVLTLTIVPLLSIRYAANKC